MLTIFNIFSSFYKKLFIEIGSYDLMKNNRTNSDKDTYQKRKNPNRYTIDEIGCIKKSNVKLN